MRMRAKVEYDKIFLLKKFRYKFIVIIEFIDELEETIFQCMKRWSLSNHQIICSLDNYNPFFFHEFMGPKPNLIGIGPFL